MDSVEERLRREHTQEAIDFARQLAKAIASDIRLYHYGESNLTKPIDEGRSLFLDRCKPGLEPLFDAALDELIPDHLDFDEGVDESEKEKKAWWKFW